MTDLNDTIDPGQSDREPATRTEERLRAAGERARDRIRDSAARAADATEEATNGVRGAARSLERRAVDPLRVPAFVRDRPLAAVGIAFGAGLLLGLGRDPGDRSWVMRKAVGKVRGAVVSGLSAAVVHEVRTLVDPSWLE